MSGDTPVDALNLNWTERELPERERTKHVHRLHPYLGKFIPQLVEVLLRKYFRPGETVVDPFCGSGTALVQANELAVNSIGYDVCAFNVLLSQAKTASYEVPTARAEVLDALQRTRAACRPAAHQRTLWEAAASPVQLSEPDNEYLRRWFAPQALRELLTYREVVETGGYSCEGLLKIILCRSARSARLTTHFDLDFPKRPQTEPYWCYKHSRTCHPTVAALKFLERYSLDSIRRIQDYALVRTGATVAVHHADSRRAAIPPVSGAITSPPYVGLIDYHEQHAYAYHLLGLEDKRESEIGAAANGSSHKARQEYQADIAAVFRNVARSMPSGGPIIVVAADRANLYDTIAHLVGVRVEAILKRHVNRRTGRRSSEFYETVFVWRTG